VQPSVALSLCVASLAADKAARSGDFASPSMSRQVVHGTRRSWLIESDLARRAPSQHRASSSTRDSRWSGGGGPGSDCASDSDHEDPFSGSPSDEMALGGWGASAVGRAAPAAAGRGWASIFEPCPAAAAAVTCSSPCGLGSAPLDRQADWPRPDAGLGKLDSTDRRSPPARRPASGVWARCESLPRDPSTFE